MDEDLMAEREFITKEKAIEYIGKRETVHVFRNGSGMIIGADWSWPDIEDLLTKSHTLEIGGDACRRMGHAVVAYNENESPCFIESPHYEG